MSGAYRYRRRGFAHERELARKLWSLGFAVMRAPASGSKAKRTVYPDVVAIMSGDVLALEVKTCKRERVVYVPRAQVEKLREFARRSGGRGFVAVKVVGTGKWRVLPVEELEETSGGNYRVPIEKLRKSLRIRDLLSIVRGARSLDEFFEREQSQR